MIGFALARIVVREAELLLLAVKRGSQRRGIGQLLLDRFIRVRNSTEAPTGCIWKFATEIKQLSSI